MTLRLLVGAGLPIRSRVQELGEAQHHLAQLPPGSPELPLVTARVRRLVRLCDAEARAIEDAAPVVAPDDVRAEAVARVLSDALRGGGRIA